MNEKQVKPTEAGRMRCLEGGKSERFAGYRRPAVDLVRPAAQMANKKHSVWGYQKERHLLCFVRVVLKHFENRRSIWKSIFLD
jgi:hypothetical protein